MLILDLFYIKKKFPLGIFYISVGGYITYYIFNLSLEDYIGLECMYNYLLYIYI